MTPAGLGCLIFGSRKRAGSRKRKWRHRKEGVRGKAGLLGRFLYFAGLPLGALNANALATEAGDLVNGLVPPATFMVYEKITPVLRDGTLLA